MTQSVNSDGITVQLSITYGAVNNIVIGTCVHAIRIDLVLNNGLACGVTLSINNNLSNENLVTYRAVLAFSQTGSSTSSLDSSVDHDGVALSSNNIRVEGVAAGTGIHSVALCGAGGSDHILLVSVLAVNIDSLLVNSYRSGMITLFTVLGLIDGPCTALDYDGIICHLGQIRLGNSQGGVCTGIKGYICNLLIGLNTDASVEACIVNGNDTVTDVHCISISRVEGTAVNVNGNSIFTTIHIEGSVRHSANSLCCGGISTAIDHDLVSAGPVAVLADCILGTGNGNLIALDGQVEMSMDTIARFGDNGGLALNSNRAISLKCRCTVAGSSDGHVLQSSGGVVNIYNLRSNIADHRTIADSYCGRGICMTLAGAAGIITGYIDPTGNGMAVQIQSNALIDRNILGYIGQQNDGATVPNSCCSNRIGQAAIAYAVELSNSAFQLSNRLGVGIATDATGEGLNTLCIIGRCSGDLAFVIGMLNNRHLNLCNKDLATAGAVLALGQAGCNTGRSNSGSNCNSVCTVNESTLAVVGSVVAVSAECSNIVDEATAGNNYFTQTLFSDLSRQSCLSQELAAVNVYIIGCYIGVNVAAYNINTLVEDTVVDSQIYNNTSAFVAVCSDRIVESTAIDNQRTMSKESRVALLILRSEGAAIDGQRHIVLRILIHAATPVDRIGGLAGEGTALDQAGIGYLVGPCAGVSVDCIVPSVNRNIIAFNGQLVVDFDTNTILGANGGLALDNGQTVGIQCINALALGDDGQVFQDTASVMDSNRRLCIADNRTILNGNGGVIFAGASIDRAVNSVAAQIQSQSSRNRNRLCYIGQQNNGIVLGCSCNRLCQSAVAYAVELSNSAFQLSNRLGVGITADTTGVGLNALCIISRRSGDFAIIVAVAGNRSLIGLIAGATSTSMGGKAACNTGRRSYGRHIAVLAVSVNAILTGNGVVTLGAVLRHIPSEGTAGNRDRALIGQTVHQQVASAVELAALDLHIEGLQVLIYNQTAGSITCVNGKAAVDGTAVDSNIDILGAAAGAIDQDAVDGTAVDGYDTASGLQAAGPAATKGTAIDGQTQQTNLLATLIVIGGRIPNDCSRTTVAASEGTALNDTLFQCKITGPGAGSSLHSSFLAVNSNLIAQNSHLVVDVNTNILLGSDGGLALNGSQTVSTHSGCTLTGCNDGQIFQSCASVVNINSRNGSVIQTLNSTVLDHSTVGVCRNTTGNSVAVQIQSDVLLADGNIVGQYLLTGLSIGCQVFDGFIDPQVNGVTFICSSQCLVQVVVLALTVDRNRCLGRNGNSKGLGFGSSSCSQSNNCIFLANSGNSNLAISSDRSVVAGPLNGNTVQHTAGDISGQLNVGSSGCRNSDVLQAADLCGQSRTGNGHIGDSDVQILAAIGRNIVILIDQAIGNTTVSQCTAEVHIAGNGTNQLTINIGSQGLIGDIQLRTNMECVAFLLAQVQIGSFAASVLYQNRQLSLTINNPVSDYISPDVITRLTSRHHKSLQGCPSTINLIARTRIEGGFPNRELLGIKIILYNKRCLVGATAEVTIVSCGVQINCLSVGNSGCSLNILSGDVKTIAINVYCRIFGCIVGNIVGSSRERYNSSRCSKGNIAAPSTLAQSNAQSSGLVQRSQVNTCLSQRDLNFLSGYGANSVTVQGNNCAIRSLIERKIEIVSIPHSTKLGAIAECAAIYIAGFVSISVKGNRAISCKQHLIAYCSFNGGRTGSDSEVAGESNKHC